MVFLGGSGEGLGLREVLKHETLKQVVMVDIDGEFMDICKERLARWHAGSFDHPKALVRTGDARAYLESEDTDKLFDVVILDFNEFYFSGNEEDRQCLQMGGLFSRQFYTAT